MESVANGGVGSTRSPYFPAFCLRVHSCPFVVHSSAHAAMNQLLSIFSLFGNLPRWLVGSIAVLVALAHLGIGLAFSPMVALIVAIGLLLLIVLLGIYFYVIKQQRDKQRAALAGELGQNSFATPTAISEMEQLKKLDGLRKTFQTGLEKFRAAGKDIYKLPWYVVIGESGAGKSEIIRRSGVGFPSGMQEEEFQGVGGTINMDWWFTNHAVILDTAGRLLTEKVPFGASSEWKEFLKLLRKHRPNCPINGLLLTIPADSLIKDSAKTIEERAGWIARQLDNIQRELDIRFPVYVLISKCDLMNGFREFFEDTDDPDAQRQMLGWSNPDPLDTPFRPDLVDQHLHTVVERLRRSRLPLIADPVARDPSRRRVEEVDRLFAFPNSVSLIAENMRRYLSTIFVAGEWSAKPLFLRGIYFTSSLREGSELDQELAEAIGVSVDELPEGRAWERDRPFFLRDLFLEKMFREWGLVTRATNTAQLLKRRKIALLSSGFIALTAISLFSWLGYKTMHDSIGDQMEYWTRASEGWDGNTWKPMIDPNTGAYAGGEDVGWAKGNSIVGFEGKQPLTEFHRNLRARSDGPLNIAPVFRLFARLTNSDAERRQAQRVVLEGSIVEPVVDAARRKIIATIPGSPSADPDRERDALISLIQIEAGWVKRVNRNPQIVEPKAALEPLIAFAANEQKEIDPSIFDVIAWTYSAGDGKGEWPGKWLSGGGALRRGAPERHNEAIDIGLEHFAKNISLRLGEFQERLDAITALEKELRDDYEKTEKDLWQHAQTAARAQQFNRDELQTPYSNLVDTPVRRVEDLIAKGKEPKLRLFDARKVSLADAYERICKEWSAYVKISRNTLLETDKELDFKDTKVQSVLLPAIRERLKTIGTAIREAPDLDPILLRELRRLDSTHLGGAGSTRFAYKERLDGYAASIAAASNTLPSDVNYVGAGFAPIEQIKLRVKLAGDKAKEYRGEYAPEFRGTCDYWLEYVKRTQIDKYLVNYRTDAEKRLNQFLLFPLVWAPEEPLWLTDGKLKEALSNVTTIRADLAALKESDAPDSLSRSAARKSLDALEKSLGSLDPVFDGLLDREKGRIRNFKISMKGVPEIRRAIEVGPVIDPASKVPIAVADPHIFYLMRPGFYEPNHISKERDLSPAVKVGVQAVIRESLPISQIFHFHTKPYKAPEPSFGTNWTVLRLLRQKNGTSTEGRRWEVNIGGMKGGDYPLDQDCEVEIEFETKIPLFQEWPTRKLFKE